MTRSSTSKSIARVGWVGMAALMLVACVEVGIPADGDKPHAELNPIQGMHTSPYKDQEAQPTFDETDDGEKAPASMRQPPAGTIPVHRRVYQFEGQPEKSFDLENPVPITKESLEYGKQVYETTCVVCHGEKGLGNGTVVGDKKYPVPPSLLSSKIRNWPDGRIYHVISEGQVRMWSYKNQLYPMERWAVINYVRALQRAEFPEPKDTERLRRE